MKKRFRQQYQAKLKADAQACDPDKDAMKRSLYFGSKCYKTASDRRPHKGGKVHF